MKIELPKRVIVPITDATEIASIERNELDDIIGACDANGNWWGYRFSVDRFRKRSDQNGRE